MRLESFLGQLLKHRLVRQWLTRKGWIEMLSTAPRPELEQALLRVAIPAAVMIYIAIDEFVGDPLTDTEHRALWFAICFFAFAVVLAALFCTQSPNLRRVEFLESLPTMWPTLRSCCFPAKQAHSYLVYIFL